ncbi:MAG TPA: cyclic nucleotide-binding domain-containing protein [Devosia sp.]|jgi:CRP-like cAMP-binding protein|nr:cyclic nucleotide-binding domain-containing protein [Devosia sp.]
MASLLALTQSQPRRTVAAGEALTTAGDPGDGGLYVLESGRLTVEREGVVIATISEPGALVGEMSVLLGIDHSATVRAAAASVVRVIDDAVAFLERSPLVALEVATLACARLDATSALLVELRQQSAGKSGEHTMLGRILNALVEPPPRRRPVVRTHE